MNVREEKSNPNYKGSPIRSDLKRRIWCSRGKKIACALFAHLWDIALVNSNKKTVTSRYCVTSYSDQCFYPAILHTLKTIHLHRKMLKFRLQGTCQEKLQRSDSTWHGLHQICLVIVWLTKWQHSLLQPHWSWVQKIYKLRLHLLGYTFHCHEPCIDAALRRSRMLGMRLLRYFWAAIIRKLSCQQSVWNPDIFALNI